MNQDKMLKAAKVLVEVFGPQIAELQKEAEDARDAARYRFLRMAYMEVEFVKNRKAYSVCSMHSTEEDARGLDALIDAAMSQDSACASVASDSKGEGK